MVSAEVRSGHVALVMSVAAVAVFCAVAVVSSVVLEVFYAAEVVSYAVVGVVVVVCYAVVVVSNVVVSSAVMTVVVSDVGCGGKGVGTVGCWVPEHSQSCCQGSVTFCHWHDESQGDHCWSCCCCCGLLRSGLAPGLGMTLQGWPLA